MRLLYSLLLSAAGILMQAMALVHGKSRLWVMGRRNWRSRLHAWRSENPGDLYWFHCASLGEFEQGRPVIERLRKEMPHSVILLTFFSPSGYEVRKSYAAVNGVFYLPIDTMSNAASFLDIVTPKQACFVKYEYWPNYFLSCKKRGIPLILISAILRPGQRFFGFWSFFWNPVMESVTHYFVQDDATAHLLGGLGIERCTVTGDTRFDRVLDVAANAPELTDAANWASNSKVLIGGSTWPADERVLHTWWQHAPTHWKLLLVPHEVGHAHIQSLLRMWPEAMLWSKRRELPVVDARVLIVDEVGQLSILYRYAHLAWIGGGFGAGIHNTLEPAAWKLPIAFGPKHTKFVEALGLIACGAASNAENEEESVELLGRLTANEADLGRMGESAGHFVSTGRGATSKIMSFLRE